MEDWLADDIWGEEPDWAKEETLPSSGGGDATAPVSILGAQHVLLLVDCHADMFQTIPNRNETDSNKVQRPMDLALELTQSLLQQRIKDTVTLKIGKRNGVGMILYNTKPLQHPNTTTNSDDDNDDDHNDEDGDDTDVEGDNDDDDARDVHVLLPLAPPGIEQVRTIRECLVGDRNLQEEYGATTTSSHRIAPLQVALEEATRIFRKAKCVKKESRTKSNLSAAADTCSIWILTNRSNPYPETADLIHNVAKDIQESGTHIVVLPLPQGGELASTDSQFQLEDFFQEIVSYSAVTERMQSKIDVDEALEGLQHQWKKIRRLYWGPILWPDWRQHQNTNDNEINEEEKESGRTPIMVDWYRFVQQAKKPSRVQVDQSTKRETIKVKQYMDNNVEIFASFRPGDADDRKKAKGGLQRIRQFYNFGGQQVPISSEDMTSMRFLANGQHKKASMTILGFKPRDCIPEYHSMDAPYLIYPNNDIVKGSHDAFAELHAAMLRKNVLAIGEVLHRIHWSSRLVAILPVEEELEPSSNDDDEEEPVQKRPPGMMVFSLPFEDDVRALEEDEAYRNWLNLRVGDSMVKEEEGVQPEEIPSNVPCTELPPFPVPAELQEAAEKLVTRQRYANAELGEDFENAAMTEFFNYLESVALELPVENDDEAEEYDTRPSESAILEALGKHIDNFVQNLPEEVELPKAKPASKKRKQKADESGLDWDKLYQEGLIGDVRVPELKSYLRSVGAPLSGNKSQLVDRVLELLAKNIAKVDPVKSEPM